ncbi:MAG TPA: LysM peptidoglycan-binding domain-containing protein [Candidatus Limnocylindria bacterium]
MSPRPYTIIGAVALGGALCLASLLSAPTMASDRVVVVRAGQTLGEIALHEGVSVEQLVALNQLADPNRIFAGQTLVVARDAAAGPAPAAVGPVSHLVSRGETLTAIARQYGTTIAAIVAANGLANPSYIRSGQTLVIPGSGEPAQPAANPQAPAAAAAAPVSHRVAPGQTLTAIARQYGTTIAAIVAANGLANPSYIRSGQTLVIPGAAADAAAPTPAAAMPPSMAELVAARLGVRDLIVAEAQRQGVPPAFALAVGWQESGWQQGVVSSAGAIGIMQLLPDTAEWIAGSMVGEPVNPWDAASNVRAGVALLRHYLDRYAGDRSLALAAYYQGQTATDRHGVFAVSRPYIASILRLEAIFAS